MPGASKMAQEVKEPAAKPGNFSSVPEPLREERFGSCKLSFDLYTCTKACAQACEHTHILSDKCHKTLKRRIPLNIVTIFFI